MAQCLLVNVGILEFYLYLLAQQARTWDYSGQNSGGRLVTVAEAACPGQIFFTYLPTTYPCYRYVDKETAWFLYCSVIAPPIDMQNIRVNWYIL